MKKALFIIISLVGLNGLVQAQQSSPGLFVKLYELDELSAEMSIGWFMGGYEMGFLSATDIGDFDEFKESVREKDLSNICPHREITAIQGAAMVYKYFKDHPEIWDKHLVVATLEAFNFYCPIKDPEQ